MKQFIIILVCMAGFVVTAQAQRLPVQNLEDAQKYRQQQYPSFFPVEALRIDTSKPPSAEISSPPRSRTRQANNGWYPLKGEVYTDSETEPAGYIYHEIGKDGLLDKEIIVGHSPHLYDSTCSIMNCTPYTKGKDLIDTTYCYSKKADGSYKLDIRRTYSYHYFDHFEADSFYYEYTVHQWDDANQQWKNYSKHKEGHHDTLVEWVNRVEDYVYGTGNTWKNVFYLHYFETYGQNGLVDTVYVSFDYEHEFPVEKCAFTYDEQGRYTQIDCFSIFNDNMWHKNEVHSDIKWTEWHGFTYSNLGSIGEEWVTPYKYRNKVESYYTGNGETSFYFNQKQWDINGTKSNSDTVWYLINDERYYSYIEDNIYNEYGDYVVWRGRGYDYPDENNEQKMGVLEYYYKYAYDEVYGMTESWSYYIPREGDTSLFRGFKYTEFAPVGISELPPNENQLIIAPNPASASITISAAAEIEQLQIFDITGRLVHSQTPTSKDVVFDTGVLAKGVYLVRALLRDGAVQTGKVVVQ